MLLTNQNILQLDPELIQEIDWANISDHEKFAATGEALYEPFKRRALSFVTGAPGSLVIKHVNFHTPVAEVAAAPVVEMLLMYVPLEAGDEVPTGVQEFLDIARVNAKGLVKAAHGWVVEELEHEKFEGKAKGYYAAIGWESVDVHMAYRETQAFKDSIPALRNLAKALSVVSSKAICSETLSVPLAN